MQWTTGFENEEDLQRQLKAALGLEEGVLESAKADRSKEEQNLREDIKRA